MQYNLALDNPYLSISEIANITNKSIKFIRREVALGKLESTKKGNKTLINKSSFELWKNNINTEYNEYINTVDCRLSEYINKSKRKADIVNWVDIENEINNIDAWKDNSQIRDFNFIDLFTGAGGLSCGLTMAGMMPVGSIEIMPQAVETYKYNFSKIKGFTDNVTNKDIRETSVKNDLINSVKDRHIHLIAGGFPCQGFSMAGNRIVTDSRNSLYLDMLEIVKRIKPDFVLMENVEGLRSMLNGKIEEKIINDYKNIGYNINVTVLDSADYGVPQFRRRVIFIGNRLGIKNFHPKPFLNEKSYKTVGDALNKFLDMPENKEINHIFAKTSDSMKKRLENVPIGKSLYGNYSDAWKKVDWNKPSCTVKENHGGVNIHPILNRVMTPRELAKLQSFPDDFIFKGAKKWQLVQIGNAVPCLLGKAIGLAILSSYDRKEKEKDND
ncbi:MAG: DNA cytosine methyltransferase [Alphaproteobacteria bacterium]|nr:DNA cytosine methyltransferase [Alphaproteobacteria bacterium]